MKRALALAFFLAAAACNNPTGIGSPCKETTDCEGGQYCDTLSPGGFCTRGCTFEGTNSECPAGSACVKGPGTALVCAPYCDTGSQCREKYACNGVKGTVNKACIASP